MISSSVRDNLQDSRKQMFAVSVSQHVQPASDGVVSSSVSFRSTCTRDPTAFTGARCAENRWVTLVVNQLYCSKIYILTDWLTSSVQLTPNGVMCTCHISIFCVTVTLLMEKLFFSLKAFCDCEGKNIENVQKQEQWQTGICVCVCARVCACWIMGVPRTKGLLLGKRAHSFNQQQNDCLFNCPHPDL